MLVRALRTHTSPDGVYRNVGDTFDHNGDLYNHVQQVETPEAEQVETPEADTPDSAS